MAITRYVKNGGSNSNNGTSDALAWETLTYAMSQMTGDQSDSFLYVKRGSLFREQVTVTAYGTSGHPFTIMPYSTGDDPKIYASLQISGWTLHSGNIWGASCASLPEAVMFIGLDDVFHWGNKVATHDLCISEYDWAWETDTIYCYTSATDGDPDTRYSRVEKHSQHRCFILNGDYIVIDGFHLRYVTEMGHHAILINSGADHNTIQNCEITQACYGIRCEGNYALIKNNYIHDLVMHHEALNGAGAIILYGHDCEVCYNDLRFCRALSDEYGMDGGSCNFIGDCDNTYVHHNFCYKNCGFMEGAASGSLLPTVSNVRIEYNICIDNGKFTGIHNDTASDGIAIENWHVYNNTLVETPGSDYHAKVAYILWHLAGSSGQYDFKNNIVYLYGWTRLCSTVWTTWDHDHNCFYMLGGTSLNITPDDTDVVENPDFVSLDGTTAASKQLTSASPCINTGVDVDLVLDYWGTIVPIGNDPDIGASEFGNTYYVSNDGDDNDVGLSENNPWQTISKVNGSTFNAGDSILFKRGDTWQEQLTVPSSGSSGNPITFGAYGTGDAPVIDGQDTRDYGVTITNTYITVDGLDIKNTNSAGVVIASTAGHVIIKNCEISYAVNYGVVFWDTGVGPGNYVQNCHIHHVTNYDGISSYRHTGSTSSDRTYIQNNVIHDCGRHGILGNSTYWIIQYNEVYSNGITNESNGISVGNTTGDPEGTGNNNIVRYNICYNHNKETGTNDGCGIGTDGGEGTAGALNNEIYYNLCYGNGGPGISIYKSGSMNVYNNVCYGNNTISGGLGRSEFRLLSGEGYDTNNIILKNNIGYATDSNAYAIYVDAATSSETLDITNNDWYDTGQVNWYFWNDSGGSNLSTWNGLTGVGTDLNSDPKFMSVVTPDFSLQPSSPCINAGTSVSLTADYLGNTVPYPPGSNPDIGAYEYQAEGSGGGGGFGLGMKLDLNL